MQLPETRRTVFLYISSFLQELLNHTQDNELDAKTLGKIVHIRTFYTSSLLYHIQFAARCIPYRFPWYFPLAVTIFNAVYCALAATLFGSIFLRDPPRSRDDRHQRSRATQITFDKKKAAFVYHFLVNDQSDFILGR